MKKLSIILLLAFSIQCKKGIFYNKKTGILSDSKTECGWLIILDDKTVLEPGLETLKKFKVTLKDKQKIKIAYVEAENQMSYCMAGKIIEVKYLANR